MQRNHETGAALAFHNATKYVVVRDEAGEEQLRMGTPPDLEDPIWQEDWSLEPFPFKIYETLAPIRLPRAFPLSSLPALEAIARTGAEPIGVIVPDLAALARIGLLANGLLNRQRMSQSGATIEYRTAGGTGARYHLELYFVCTDLPDLGAGIYHYAAHDHTLRQLRAGDFRGALVEATGGEPAVAHAPVMLGVTSTFWRNAWRYKGRAYRHTYWDAGTSLSHVLAVAASAGLPTELVLGYADAPVNGLLGVDGEREATVALCAIGRMNDSTARSLNNQYIGTEHLLLALVHEGEGIAAGVLESLGVSLEKVRQSVLSVVSRSSTYQQMQQQPPMLPTKQPEPSEAMYTFTMRRDTFRQLAELAIEQQRSVDDMIGEAIRRVWFTAEGDV